MTKQSPTEVLLSLFGNVRFHVGNEEGNVYCVASFKDDTLTALANLLSFDEYHEFERLDKRGNVQLSDNGSPFESVADVQETLLSVFSTAIEEGWVSEESLKAQIRVHPYGVDRSVLN